MKTIGLLISCLFVVAFTFLTAQKNEKTVKANFFEGTVVAGYIDQGAYINFLGPNVNITKGNHKWIVGMLPSLRFKKDTGATRNSFVTPNLGLGLTYVFKKIAFQLPIYYNVKSSTKNGGWNVGVGVGIKLK